MASVLERIFADKRVELDERRRTLSPDAIKERAAHAPNPRTFVAALASRRPAIIAEIKRASPSKGDILPGLDPAVIAATYAADAAAAISAPTDAPFKCSLY